MKKKLQRWLTDAWYTEMYLSTFFTPLSLLYLDGVRFRRFLYRTGVLKQQRLPVPVVIVGNITVGGTGKTPLVINLVDLCLQQGLKPGVISRGFTGTANQTPQAVSADTDPRLVGDEAVLLAQRCPCPVAVGANRAEAARFLLARNDCDMIIADDGLQHYALHRDIEIIVIDGERRFGNGYLLPAGPLREPQERVKEVDFVLVNGGDDLLAGELPMVCRGDELLNLATGERKPLAALHSAACHALAAIGNPNRFFKQLQYAGLNCSTHAFPDHYFFKPEDIRFHDQQPVIMTEKDAVKCRQFADDRHWCLPVTAEIPAEFSLSFLKLLKDKLHG